MSEAIWKFTDRVSGESVQRAEVIAEMDSRARDAFLAEKLLGWKRVHRTHLGAWVGWKPTTRDTTLIPPDAVEPFGTDVVASRIILNAMRERGHQVKLEWKENAASKVAWTCRWRRIGRTYTGRGSTEMQAICNCAVAYLIALPVKGGDAAVTG